MTDEQIRRIIKLYNDAVRSMVNAESLMDSENAKISAKGDRLFDLALKKQETIDTALEELGYELVINDEDIAIDIQKADGQENDACEPPHEI